MQRFFVNPDQITDTHVYVRGTDYGHMAHVLRMKPGESFVASIRTDDTESSVRPDGAFAGEYYCVIEAITEEEIIAKIAYRQTCEQELPCEITLFQGLPKGDKMELIIQKAVELGANSIVPVAMKRSVVKIEPNKAAKKTERWQAIAESAAKQSGRGIIPRVWEPISYQQALKEMAAKDVRLIPYENARGMDGARQLISSIRPGQSIGIMIGPEGGFDEEEISKALELDCQTMTLGKRILRTETAGLCILSIIMFMISE